MEKNAARRMRAESIKKHFKQDGRKTNVAAVVAADVEPDVKSDVDRDVKAGVKADKQKSNISRHGKDRVDQAPKCGQESR